MDTIIDVRYLIFDKKRNKSNPVNFKTPAGALSVFLGDEEVYRRIFGAIIGDNVKYNGEIVIKGRVAPSFSSVQCLNGLRLSEILTVYRKSDKNFSSKAAALMLKEHLFDLERKLSKLTLHRQRLFWLILATNRKKNSIIVENADFGEDSDAAFKIMKDYCEKGGAALCHLPVKSPSVEKCDYIIVHRPEENSVGEFASVISKDYFSIRVERKDISKINIGEVARKHTGYGYEVLVDGRSGAEYGEYKHDSVSVSDFIAFISENQKSREEL